MRKSIFASALIAAVSACDPEWAEWGEWSSCSEVCGAATRSRDRVCNPCTVEGSGDSAGDIISECSGDSEETEDCDNPGCPEWSDWEETGTCTVTCGGGQVQMTRDCWVDGEMVASSMCDGDSITLDGCNFGECGTMAPTTMRPTTTTEEFIVPDVPTPVQEETTDNDGYWTSWTAWSACTRTCDGGTRSRERRAVITNAGATLANVDNPDFEYEHGDFSVEYETCNEDACGQCVSTQWTEFTSCVGKCGSEPAFRTRSCTCTGMESREFCSSVSTYIPDHSELSIEDYETSKPTHWFEEIPGGQTENEIVYCEDLGFNECPAPPAIPLVESAKFSFTISASQQFGVPSIFFINGDLEQPTNEVAWDSLVAGIRMWIGEQSYHPADFGYMINAIDYEPGHGTVVGVTMTLYIHLSITVAADASTGLNPLSMADLTARMTTLHEHLVGTSADTDVDDSRRRRRQAGSGFVFVPFGNAVLNIDEFFDAVDAGVSSVPNTVTAVFPNNALYQLFESSVDDVALSGAFLGTGCHCMRLGTNTPSVDRELGGNLALDNLDRICKRWFGQHRCAFADGGNCVGLDHLMAQAYFVEFDPTAGLLCDTVPTWNPTASAAELTCLADMCAIDNSFTLQALDHVSLVGGITVNPGVDPVTFVSQCEHQGGTNTTKTCTGTAPNLKWA